MPKTCSYGVCKQNSFDKSCSFYGFPSASTQPDRRKLWAIRCGRKTADGKTWEPSATSKCVYICKHHFVTGEPWNYKDHPDYAPSLSGEATTITTSSSCRDAAVNRFSRNVARRLKATVPLKINATKPVHASSGSKLTSTLTTVDICRAVELDHSYTLNLINSNESQLHCSMDFSEIDTMSTSATLLRMKGSDPILDRLPLSMQSETSTVSLECSSVSVDVYQTSSLIIDDVEMAQHSLSLSFDALKCKLSSLNCCGFMSVANSSYIMFVKLTNESNPVVMFSVAIDQSFKCHIYVFGWKLDDSHFIWERVPTVFDTEHSVRCLIVALNDFKMCMAVTDSSLLSSMSACGIDGAVRVNTGRCFQNDKMCDCLRASKCELLLNIGKRCVHCTAIHKRLCKRVKRKVGKRNTSKCQTSGVLNSRRNNIYLSSPLKMKKLKLLAFKKKQGKKQITVLRSKIDQYKHDCQTLIEMHGEKLNDEDSDNVLQLTKECESLIEFPEDSFQHILFKQQLEYNRLKNKASMRWHPSVIRWCLSIKSKSAKVYGDMKSFLSLPSNRTLFDYTHYMEHGLGINPRVVEQLINQAAKLGCFVENYKSFVGLLFDEIKIKSDLVYNKTSGDIVGYVNLDNVSNELLQLQFASGSSAPQLADHMLVTMVRGVATNLCYPLSAYASKTASSTTLYSIIWECIEYLEMSVGLKVLYLCCDGAVQNRSLFQLYSPDGGFVHKTLNKYALEERYLFFVSDPPHLLKTARNCFANSGSHLKSRNLWFNGDISWMHIVKLYEEHCEQSEFKLCPKLTRSHVDLTSFSKMKVSLAAQVLSSTVSNALDHVYGERFSSTATFIRIMDKWFDVMNVKHLYEGRNKRNTNLLPFTDVNDERLVWLTTDFLRYFDDWHDAVSKRCGNFSYKQRQQMQLSFQTLCGLKMTSLSVAKIVEVVLQAGAPFVLTNHINQDPLEQLFGHCRHKGGSNENPNVQEACHAVNTIRTVNTQSVSVAHCNTQASVMKLDCTPLPKRSSCRKRLL